MACSGSRLITFHKAWDKTILPKPFSRITVIFGEPVPIPADLGHSELEKICQNLEDKLNHLTDEVDSICGIKRLAHKRRIDIHFHSRWTKPLCFMNPLFGVRVRFGFCLAFSGFQRVYVRKMPQKQGE